ncbi:MAG: Inner membrane protein YrbG [Chlamydiae bacterium]|nr:Inner membrane protein YrbG [Chlamydiota bacterium]
MGLSWMLILLGAILLYVGAELLVRSAVQIALHFKLSRLIIGLTVVAFCTSMPEALVSIIAQLKGGSGDISLGNVLGSNIANLSLVLGVYLMLRPCDVTHEMKWQKMPQLLFVYLMVFFVMLGGTINRVEGVFLLFVLGLYILHQYTLPPKKQELEEEIRIHDDVKRAPVRIKLQIFAVISSGILLILGTQSLIDGALKIATHYQISERIIAISLLAFGTSLPELATAIVGAFRKEQEIIVGTLVGSNIFNPLLILPCATFIKPIVFSSRMLIIDFPIMVVFTIILWVLMVLGHDRLSRVDGAILLFAYFSYIAFLYL